MKFYKLRDMSNGKYSTGGTDPIWDPKWDEDGGKVWMKLDDLKGHLAMWAENNKAPISPFWEVIEMEVTEVQAYPAIAITGKKK